MLKRLTRKYLGFTGFALCGEYAGELALALDQRVSRQAVVEVIGRTIGRSRVEELLGVVQRLPAAMRYPASAAGWIEYKGRRYGSGASGDGDQC